MPAPGSGRCRTSGVWLQLPTFSCRRPLISLLTPLFQKLRAGKRNCGQANPAGPEEIGSRMHSVQRTILGPGLALLLALCALAGCKTVAPSNAREWAPELAILPFAEFHGDLVKVHNVRNCTWLTATDYVVNHYDRVYDLGALKSVDFVVSPFMAKPNLAHTMLDAFHPRHPRVQERLK